MTNRLDLDTGTAAALADELRGAPSRVEATLQPAQLAGTLDDLGEAVRGAWAGPYAVALAAGTRVEASPELAVVTGGSAGALSGGATAGDLALGVEFGGGRRVGTVRSGRRSRAHTRRTTQQFRGQTLTQQRAVEGAADAGAEQLADALERTVAP